jgi:hypothetical protein
LRGEDVQLQVVAISTLDMQNADIISEAGGWALGGLLGHILTTG